jgi:hypothetical protein
MNIFVPVRRDGLYSQDDLYSLYNVGIAYAEIRSQKSTAESEKHITFVCLGAPGEACDGFEAKFKTMQNYFEIEHYSHALKCGFNLTIMDVFGFGAVLEQIANSVQLEKTEIDRLINELNEYGINSWDNKTKKLSVDIKKNIAIISGLAEEEKYKEMRTTARICLNSYTYLSSLPDSAPSVFLGLFLAAAQRFQSLRFNDDMWDSVTVTGNMDFTSGNLLAVKNIGKKFNGLFQDYVKENPAKSGKKHLFLYVTDETPLPIREGDHDNNIYVKAYSIKGNAQPPDEFDVIDYVFKPVSSWAMSVTPNPREMPASAMFPGMEGALSKDAGELRVKLAENFLVNRRDLGKRYIETPDYRRMRERALRSPDFWGYFIEGEGSRGKSFTAAELAHYLLYMGRFFAVIWIGIKNEDIENIWQRKADGFSPSVNKEDTKKYIEYLEARICEQPGISKEILNGPLANHPHLIVIDNLELPKHCLSDFLSGVKEFLANRRMASCIITSREIEAGNELGDNIEPIKVPKFLKEHTKELFHGAVTMVNALGKINKYKEAEGDGRYDKFIDLVHDTIGEFPGVITIFGNLLKQPDIEIYDLINLLDKDLGAEDTIRKAIVNIYEATFNHLTDAARKLLLFLLNFGADMEMDEEQIEKEINKAEVDLGLEKGASLKDFLKSTLRELVDSLLLYCP